RASCSAAPCVRSRRRHERARRDPPHRQWRAGREKRARAAESHRFPARGAWPHRHARRLRAWRLRRLHAAHRRRDLARLPRLRRPARRFDGRNCRRAFRQRRNRRSPGAIPRAERAAMRLLHCRHAGGVGRAAAPRRGAEPRRDPRVSLRQLLPLHRLSGDHRRGRGGVPRPRRKARTMSGPLSFLDRPNSYIGRSVPRPNAKRLLQGRGTYVDDLRLPRLVHAAFLRSPYAHARIVRIDTARAAAQSGVLRIVTAADLAGVYTPWVGVLTHMKGMKSAPQHPLAQERARWQGEPVAAVVAESRAVAEDAVSLIEVQWEELPPLVSPEAALAPGAAPLHPELGDNLAFARSVDAGAVDDAFARADAVVEETFTFARHTGVCPETRSLLADFNPADRQLTLYCSSQAPHMMKEIVLRHFKLGEGDVRVVCRDVGGSYGIKIHVYPDEMTVIALALLLGRPVKFIADRLESFVSDIHARAHRIKGRIALSKTGEILAFEIDDLAGIGPYSTYPRSSVVEGGQVVNLVGSWYRSANYRARLAVAFQTKPPMSQYRAVGHPIACAVTEALVDRGAHALGLDPAELRRRNLIADDAYPWTSPAGLRFEKLSHQRTLARLMELMD